MAWSPSCSYYYSKRRSWLLLGVAVLFSLGARWEQVAILIVFLGVKSRYFPLRHRPKAALALMILSIGVLYALAVRHRGAQLAVFLEMAKMGGTVARLDAIQAHFGFPLVVLPKALMNLFDRWLTPWYFLSPVYWFQDFHFLQNQVIIYTQTLAMLILFIALFASGRLRLYRPIPLLIAIYVIAIAVNPFINPRYDYPIYALLCVEMARREDTLEPEPLPRKHATPALPVRRWHDPSAPGATASAR